jgi:hypothetical protein
MRVAIVLSVVGLRFDTADFVLNNIDFLRDNLLDSTLQDDIELAIAGASGNFDQTSLNAAQLVAGRALYHLFENPNMFNVQNPSGGPSPNDPATSFNAAVGGMDKDNGRSGLRDALRNHFETMIGTLGFYYALYNDPLYDRKDAQNVIRLADSLSAELKAKVTSLWKDFRADNGEIVNVMDDGEYTEVLRRIWGFMTAIENMLRPLLGPAAADAAGAAAQLKARQTFQRLTKHLVCNESYYTQRYLRYMADRTNNQAIVDLASSVLQKIGSVLPTSPLLSFDTDRAFIDKNQIIVPGLTALSADDLVKIGQLVLGADSGAIAPPLPSVVQLDVPTDGIHLEVAPGACVLPNVPEREFDLNLTLGGVNLGVKLVDQSNS